MQEIDQEIRDVKQIESEKVSYMTLAMKMMEERKEGRKEGIALVAISMLKLKLSLDVIQAATGLPIETIKKLAVENNISI